MEMTQFKTESEQLQELQDNARNLINQEGAANIVTSEDNDKAADLAKLLRTYLKKIEDDRTSITGPLNSVIKTINDKYKRITNPIQKAIDSLKVKMTDYARAEAKRQQEEADRQRAIEEEAALAAAESASTEEAEEIMNTAAEKGEAIGSKAASVKGLGNFGGSSHTASKLLWEIVNPEMVPAEFLSVDSYKVQSFIDRAKMTQREIGTSKGLKGADLTNFINKEVARTTTIAGIKITSDIEVRVR